METPMSNSELYYMLVERGYKIDIIKENKRKDVDVNYVRLIRGNGFIFLMQRTEEKLYLILMN